MTNLLNKIFRRKSSKRLYSAITYENLELARELLKSGYNANMLDELGQTPLFRIIYNCTDTQVDFLKLFISYGADVNFQKPSDGASPIFYAKGNALKFLLKNGAKLTIKNNSGSTPLHEVSQVEDAKLFIALGLNINDKNNTHSTLLHGSVYGTNDLVKFCIDSGSEINAQDINGWTPLMCLALTEYVTEKNEQTDILIKAEYLITAGADVNMVDIYGKTASVHADSVNNREFAEWLQTKMTK